MDTHTVEIDDIRSIATEFVDIIGYAIDVDVAKDVDDVFYTITFTGENLGALIGFRGRNIQSIELLINLMLAKRFHTPKIVNIDINGYRKDRMEYIRKYVDNAISKVQKTAKEYRLHPMSSYERLYVHNYVKDYADLETESSGEEPNRFITIKQKVL